MYTLKDHVRIQREVCRNCGYSDMCDGYGCDAVLDRIEQEYDEQSDREYDDLG